MTAYAAVQNVSSYETLKTAVLNYGAFDNGTLNAELKVYKNGIEIISGNMVNKLEDAYSSSLMYSTAFNGNTEVYQSWDNREKSVYKNSASDEYVIRPRYNYGSIAYSSGVIGWSFGREWESLTSTQQNFINAMIDLTVGDIKNYFTSASTSGGTVISLNLSKNQIPQVAQLLLAVAVEEMQNSYENGYADDIYEVIPAFSVNTEIQSASMILTLDDNNRIIGGELTGVIRGTDIYGESHELVFEVSSSVTDVGTTKADTIDLTGLNVFNPEDYYTWTYDENGNRITFSTQEEWENYIGVSVSEYRENRSDSNYEANYSD